MLRPALAGLVALAVTAAPAAGQAASPPGPWIVDIRGATSGVPTDLSFYPSQNADFLPTRGFGIDLGGHLYLFTVGPARVGLGANVVMIRSTVTDQPAAGQTSPQRLSLNLRTVAPQLSFNFGTGDGWSYLSAGVGIGSIKTRAEGPETGEQDSGQLRSINFGGGARWFLSPRVAIGFDVRAHQLAAGSNNPTPRTTAVAVSAGLSLR